MRKLLNRLWEALRRSDDLQTQLFAFLSGSAAEFPMLGGKRLSRDEVRLLLQELIPARIELRGVCRLPIAAVASAPHVSFDNWSEFFCHRVARRFNLGWVVARNFRDHDPHTIPAPIGRHIHVNRPMESAGPGKLESVTERATRVHEEYLAALKAACGRGELPMDLLIEFHSHHRTPFLEVATVGVEPELAQRVFDAYTSLRPRSPLLPEMRIEPLHEVRMTADNTKRLGSLRADVARRALHLEIPREARRADFTRHAMCNALFVTTDVLLKNLADA
jgi:hypothetical protein